MKEDLHILETIDNYLNDRMSQEERIAFEQKMASDKSLAQKVEEERQVNEAIHFASLAELRASIGQDIKDIKYTSGNSFNTYLISGLLLLGTGVSAYLILDNNKETETVRAENTISQKQIIIEKKQEEPVSEIYIQKKSAPENSSVNKDKHTEISENTNSSKHITTDEILHEIKTIAEPINTTEDKKPDLPVQIEVEEPKADPILNNIKLATCNQSFTFSTKPTCQGKSTGTISIRGNLNHTNIYELDKVLTFPTNGVFTNISAGKHEIVIKYQDSCKYIETIEIGEEWCSLNHSFSFNPEYGEKWELLYNAGDHGNFIILNNFGKELYKGDFGIGKCFWNGSDSYGSILPTGAYLAIINHSDGRKEKVELTIVR